VKEKWNYRGGMLKNVEDGAAGVVLLRACVCSARERKESSAAA
jgi:hypothetical protein